MKDDLIRYLQAARERYLATLERAARDTAR